LLSAIGLAAALGGCARQAPVTPPTGSADSPSGNIVNSGWVASADGLIYYSTTSGLFCIHPDGTKAQISSHICRSMNIADGWIYFVDRQVNVLYGFLCKMRTDGTEEQQLAPAEIDQLFVADGWIYYTDSTFALYKIQTDGTQTTPLNISNVHNIIVSGEWIYYTHTNGSDGIYRVRTDGTEQTELVPDGQSFDIANGVIYYANILRGLYKTDLDGQHTVQLSDDELCENVVVSEGWIYYLSESSTNILYKIRMDGTGKTMLYGGITLQAVNITENWLFFYNMHFYRFNIDSMEGMEQLE